MLIPMLERPSCMPSRLVCIENTQCWCGGRALPLEWLKEVKQRTILFRTNKIFS